MTGDAFEDLGQQVVRSALGALYGLVIGAVGGLVGGAVAGWCYQPQDPERDTLLSDDRELFIPQRRANGGPVPFGWYTVGERGPELVTGN